MTEHAGDDARPSTIAIALIEAVYRILSVPGAQANLEHRGAGYRLRYKDISGLDGKRRRRSLELPADEAVITAVRQFLDMYRRMRIASRESGIKRKLHARTDPGLDAVHRKIITACPRGRVIRRRIGMVFRIAAELGFDTLRDFIGREPWLAKPKRAGRPSKREGDD